MDIRLKKNKIIITAMISLCFQVIHSTEEIECERDDQCQCYFSCCNHKCYNGMICPYGSATQCKDGHGCEGNAFYDVCCGTTCVSIFANCQTTTRASNNNNVGNQEMNQNNNNSIRANSTNGTSSTVNQLPQEEETNLPISVIPSIGSEKKNKTEKSPVSLISNDLKQEKVDVLPSECSFWCPKSCCNGDGTCQPFSKCLGLCNNDFDCGTNWQSCCSSWSIDVGVFDDDLKAIFQSHYSDIRKGAYNETHCVDKQYVSTVNSEIANSLKSITDRQLKIEVQCQSPLRMISFIAILFVIAGLVAINIWSCIFLKRRIRQRGFINPIPIQVNQSNERIFNQFDSTLDSFNLDDEDGQNTHAYQDIEVSDTEEDPKNTMGAQ